MSIDRWMIERTNQVIMKAKSLLNQYEIGSARNEIDELLYGNDLIDVITDIRRYKSVNNLSIKTEMDFLDINCKPKFYDWFKQTENDIKACANVKEIRVTF